MKKLIFELFVNKEKYVIDLLEKYNIEKPLQNLISLVEERLNGENENEINGISSSFLTLINTKYLSNIQNTQEKEELEYIVSEIGQHLLLKFIQLSEKPKYEVIKELQVELKTTCELNNYDYDALNKRMPIESLVKFAKDSHNKSEENNLLSNLHNYYYQWNGRDSDLDYLIRNLKSENHILQVRNFKKIFSKHTGELTIKINRDSINFIFLLLKILHEKSLIIPKGNNTGVFYPLKLFAVDFDNKILIKGDAKYISYKLRKKSPENLLMQEKIHKWILNISLKK